MIRVTSMFVAILLVMSAGVWAQTIDTSRLDPKPYDAAVDPDVGLFINSWRDVNSVQMRGTLAVRDILTPLNGTDPLRPASKGAVLTAIKYLRYATLAPNAATDPVRLRGEQELYYITAGEGVLRAGGKTVTLRNGIGLIVPPDIEFTIENHGSEPLGMYLVVEPVPAGFTPQRDIVVRDEFELPITDTTVHWAHIGQPLLKREDGLAVLDAFHPMWILPNTMGQPHSHIPGTEEIWISLDESGEAFLGKTLQSYPSGTAYKIPANGMTPHSTINHTEAPIKTFLLLHRPEEQTPSQDFSMLVDGQYDPSVDANIDYFIGDYRNSVSSHRYGGLIERDIFRPVGGDPLDTTVPQDVLTYADRFTYATLLPHIRTQPATLDHTQEMYYVVSGQGEITGAGETWGLEPGAAVLIPVGIEFSMRNIGDAPLEMYCVAEPVPEGFTPKTRLVMKYESDIPILITTAHWINSEIPLFKKPDGLASLTQVLVVTLPPRTFAQPHSHTPGTEEVWAPINMDITFLMGKMMRTVRPGAAYMVPPNGNTAHANINFSHGTMKVFYFARFGDPATLEIIRKRSLGVE